MLLKNIPWTESFHFYRTSVVHPMKSQKGGWWGTPGKIGCVCGPLSFPYLRPKIPWFFLPFYVLTKNSTWPLHQCSVQNCLITRSPCKPAKTVDVATTDTSVRFTSLLTKIEIMKKFRPMLKDLSIMVKKGLLLKKTSPIKEQRDKTYPIWDWNGQNRYPIYDSNGWKTIAIPIQPVKESNSPPGRNRCNTHRLKQW